ncbi:MAG TPA: NAD-dependent deacylase [Candidatus Limnocylindrales bacterium]|nr:NAD-dependent deacylase [Candidatus Limnocylindrales bacterium]
MPIPENLYRKAAEFLASRGSAVALTGAGISVESGIPAFRGAQGMWERFDPAEYATIGAFLRDPAKVWEMLAEMIEVLTRAEPNPAHRGLAELERMGILRSVITQNVDGLHQAAGSSRVIEYHGNPRELVCVECWKRHPSLRKIAEGIPPRCDCGAILKPDIVFFGEPIPWAAQEQAEEEARTCGVLLVIGTSAQVSPACDIPRIAKERGARIVEINPEETSLTRTVTDLHIPGNASSVISGLLSDVRRRTATEEKGSKKH